MAAARLMEAAPHSAVHRSMAAVRLMEASLHSAADRRRVGETAAVASPAVAAVAAALKAVAVVAGSTWEGGYTSSFGCSTTDGSDSGHPSSSRWKK